MMSSSRSSFSARNSDSTDFLRQLLERLVGRGEYGVVVVDVLVELALPAGGDGLGEDREPSVLLQRW